MKFQERHPRDPNKNRKGPIRELLAIVDVDLEGNTNVLKVQICPNGCQRPLLAVEEDAFEVLQEAYWRIVQQSSRKIQLIRFTGVEIVLGD